MATTDDLRGLGFTPSTVTATELNIDHPSPSGWGPFCRLRVETAAPEEFGVYVWVVDREVRYVGKATKGFGLVQKVRGARMGRAYDDYTYVPPSKAAQVAQTRARINGLLNRAITEGHEVEWWWIVPAAPADLERLLIEKWDPAWNIALRLGRDGMA